MNTRSRTLQRLSRDTHSFHFDGNAPAAMTIASGETVVVETNDANDGTVNGRAVRARPVTGPIAIDGAKPGDLLAIEILDVVAALERGSGSVTASTLASTIEPVPVTCFRRGDVVEIPTRRGTVRVPYRPTVGTLGLAPDGAPVDACSQRGDTLGTVDLPEISGGCTVMLRANVPGGMVSLGGAHLAQGDAAIHGSVIGSQADVTIRITNLGADSSGSQRLPQINNREQIGSVAPGPGHLEDLVRAAYDDLAARLRDDYGFTLTEAYRVLGAVGTVRIGHITPEVSSALAMIERRYLIIT